MHHFLESLCVLILQYTATPSYIVNDGKKKQQLVQEPQELNKVLHVLISVLAALVVSCEE